MTSYWLLLTLDEKELLKLSERYFVKNTAAPKHEKMHFGLNKFSKVLLDFIPNQLGIRQKFFVFSSFDDIEYFITINQKKIKHFKNRQLVVSIDFPSSIMKSVGFRISKKFPNFITAYHVVLAPEQDQPSSKTRRKPQKSVNVSDESNCYGPRACKYVFSKNKCPSCKSAVKYNYARHRDNDRAIYGFHCKNEKCKYHKARWIYVSELIKK